MKAQDIGAWKSARLWAWGVPLTCGLLALWLLVGGGQTECFLQINSWSEATGDALWANLTVLGDGGVCAVVLLMLVSRRPSLFWALLISAVGGFVLLHGLKNACAVSRPPAVLQGGAFHVIGPARHTGSFPSGHSAMAFSAAALAVRMTSSRALRWTCVVLASVVALSRVVVGVHWPLDILGGAALGWCTGLAAVRLAERRSWGHQQLAERLGACLLGLASLNVFADDLGFGSLLPLQAAVGVLGLLSLSWAVRGLRAE